ncbi:MAG: preprotein translocase subunit SecE [Fusobacteriaceae bacterium]|jgi:preprotein translocase subunit SecE|nr:preprotein translocase subunit SecE [Fusobacteriaceae bacterium]
MNVRKIIEEYSKVQWPRKREIIEATAWVITMSVALSIYLGIFDFVANTALKRLVSLFGG